jgi:hypothetical protein
MDKRYVMGIAVAAIVAPQLSGCWLVTHRMQSMEGRTRADLLAAWGEPTQTLNDGEGGKIWVYVEDRFWNGPGEDPPAVSSFGVGSEASLARARARTPGMVSGWKAYRAFWVAEDGKITGWTWKGI